MVTRRMRKTDTEDTNGYKQRAWIQPKEIVMIVSFLLGGGLGNCRNSPKPRRLHKYRLLTPDYRQ